MKKIVLILVGAGLLILAWYLFIKSHEFEVKFKASTLPGDIIQTIRIWDKSLATAEVVKVDSLSGLTQKISVQDRSYVYDWNFRLINDSTTEVIIKITDPARSFVNKILVPFTDTEIERDAKDVAQKFYSVLKMHLNITGAKVIGESETEDAFCICRALETSQIEKAHGMMRDYALLTSFVSTYNFQPNGPPIVKVREWNHSKGKLKFDFCFPIVKRDFLPASDSISYKQLSRERALKAVYNGNYITSDRAWYTLIHFAQNNGYRVSGLPIEYFHNNPNLGLNEKDWKAEIYLPIE